MTASIALGWLLGASPLLAAAKVADEAREAAEAQNATYSQELVILKDQFAGIEKLEAQLGDLRAELPSGAALPAYLNQLSTEAQKHSVTLTTITTADAVAYAPTAAEAPIAETPPADAEAPADADAAAPAAEAVPAAPAEGAGVPVTSPLVTAENFIAIPITLAFDGGYDNVLAFVESLQKGTRLTAVTAFSTTKEDAAAAAPSEDGAAKAAPAATDAVTGTMSLLIYVLLDPTAEG
ncbi:hypothetical protein [Cryobacterium sp. W22_MBD10_FK3]|uniref:hypothetical protein n=1 Tax=Cryobacterium sp. W22_MBD10_FK3 TaxID=3240273 RepID=UPI003F90BB57